MAKQVVRWRRPTASERAKRNAIKVEIEADNFLESWLDEWRAGMNEFARDTHDINTSDKEAGALRAGFRTWRQYVDCLKDQLWAHRMFVEGTACKALWKKLKAEDLRRSGIEALGVPLYGPQNGSVPQSLLRNFETWHKKPKLTAAEAVRHHKKILKAAGSLLDLMAQITPGALDDRFARFELDAPTVKRLLHGLHAPEPKTWRRGERPSDWHFETAGTLALQAAGITPTWGVEAIKQAAEIETSWDLLPRKVRAASAKRTFMIKQLASGLSAGYPRSALPVGDQLIADVIAEIANSDCSLDDVRKCLAEWRLEDSYLNPAGILQRKT